MRDDAHRSTTEDKPTIGQKLSTCFVAVTTLVNTMVDDLRTWTKRTLPLEPQVVPLMTYEEVLRYFISDRPDDPRVAKGALLFDAHPEGKLLTQLFLDENNEMLSDAKGLPYGRKLIATAIDQDLDAIREDHDFLVVE